VIGAVKHAMLGAIDDMLETDELDSPDPQPHAKRTQHRRTTKRLIQSKLGHTVTLGTSTAPEPVATPA
jgi:hypothetical protein